MGRTKVLISVVLALLLLAIPVLGACAKGAPATETVTKTTTQTTTKTETKTVEVPLIGQLPGKLPKDQQIYYFMGQNLADPFWVSGVKGFKAAGKLLGVKTEFFGPSDLNVAVQVKMFQEVLAKPGTAGVLAYSPDWNALGPLTEEALKKGIPVIHGALDWGKPRTAFIGVDYPGQTIQAAEVTAKTINGKGVVGYMGNNQAHVIQRGKEFEKYLVEKYPGIRFAGSVIHDGSVADATRKIEAFVGKNPDLNALFFGDGLGGSLGDIMSQRAPNVKFITMDMPPITLQGIKDGKIYTALGMDTYTEEFVGLILLYLAYHGYRVPDVNYVAGAEVTKGNVDYWIDILK